MRILVVAATKQEVEGLISDLRIFKDDLNKDPDHVLSVDMVPALTRQSEIVNLSANCDLLITGVGMVATAYALGEHLVNKRYDMVLNLGIAGSFDRSIALGDVVEIAEDTFAELGAENDEDFISMDEMGFGKAAYRASTTLESLYNLFNTFDLPRVTAITVNTVHGNEKAIRKVTERLQPQLESMEGAAVFYACQQAGISCLQIRAVSNYVEKRNRNNWKIGLAIKNLNTFAVEFLKLYA